jgi:hypothetical protein
MGLQRVLILAEVSLLPSKSQDSSSGLEVVGLEVMSRGVSPAVSGRTDSKSDPAGGCHAAARWCLAPWDLLSRVRTKEPLVRAPQHHVQLALAPQPFAATTAVARSLRGHGT